MIDLSFLNGRTIGVLGYGVAGAAAAAALKAGGAEVHVFDDFAAQRRQAAADSWQVTDFAAPGSPTLDGLVVSPGIPLVHPAPHPAIVRARQTGVDILGDVELLARADPRALFIGITGTNGKSTTTALVHHILKSAGRRVAAGANLGTPALALEQMGEDGIYVLEMSSFQIDLTATAVFDLAVLLNIAPDHLDRHGDMAGYVAAKARLLGLLRDAKIPGGRAVIGLDDPHCRALAADAAASLKDRLLLITAGGKTEQPSDLPPPAIAYHGGGLVDRAGTRLFDLARAPALPGRHNAQNAAAAWAIAATLGVAAETIAGALTSFPGLPHRQERVCDIDRILYINDSKATNADAAARALGCYDNIFWLAGGLPKSDGIAALAPYFPRIRRAYLMGKASDSFARTLRQAAGGGVPHRRCGDLASAVAAAHKDARAELDAGKISHAVVLLSPACASFDQWPDFTARGDAFRAMVTSLAPAQERNPAL